MVPDLPVLTTVVAQHVVAGADLRAKRSSLLRAPHVDLLLLARDDERLRAHLDGLAVAGDVGYRMAQVALEEAGGGPTFVLMVAAIERRDRAQMDRLLALLKTAPDAERALTSGFGWASAESLRGLIAPLMTSSDTRQRWLAISACAAHRVDPGPALAQAIENRDSRLRARSLRTAGQLGLADLIEICSAHTADPEPECGFQAAWSATLIGGALLVKQALGSVAFRPGPYALEALQLLLLSSDVNHARATVRQLAKTAAPRTVIQATGWAGDLQAVPWLIEQMTDDRLARVAGEAFTLLTGADLVRLQLERTPPEKINGGPTENAEDEDVKIDEDENLPWPDAAKIVAWWNANRSRLPTGVRCFMGQAPTREHCMNVLKTGYQRQRSLAAQLLCLSRPGTPLFNIAAPAWRQQRLLSKL